MIKLSSDNKDDKKEAQRKVIDLRVVEVSGFNLILEWGKKRVKK